MSGNWARSAGGGWRKVGRWAGSRNARADSGESDSYYRPVRGYHFLHTAIDAHSRLAYSELLGYERKATELDSGCYRSGVDTRCRAHTALADVPDMVNDVEERIEEQRTLDLLGNETSGIAVVSRDLSGRRSIRDRPRLTYGANA